MAEAALEGGQAVAKLSMQDILALFRNDADQNYQGGGEEDIALRNAARDPLLQGDLVSCNKGDIRAGSPGAIDSIQSKAGWWKQSEHPVYGRR